MKFKYLYLLLILTFMSSCNNTQENNSKEIKGKIVHSVYFWLNDPQNQDDVKTFETAIKKLMKNTQFANQMHFLRFLSFFL